MSPAGANPAPKESVLQAQTAGLLREHCLPSWKWTHFPAGEARSAITGARLKRFGLNRGWPDFILLSPEPVRIHFLELKRLNAPFTGTQREFAAWCGSNAVPYETARTVGQVLSALGKWGCLRVAAAL
ncbi:MAG: hypothetical protein ACREBU_01805 [Nitrososphaera sp.]